MVCPLCEHVQEQGDSCDQCGMALATERPAPIQVDPFSELEPTRLEPIGEVPILPLQRLERGREESTPGPPAQRTSVDLAEEDEVAARCPNCGVPGFLGRRCIACGVPLLKGGV